VHDVLNAGRDDGPGYTTVLKTMQIMMGKGLVERDETQRPQVYRPADRQHETQRRLLRDLVNRAFGGSHRQLVLQALADRKATPAELQAIEALLDRMEEKPK
jgi:predicted transcriptional regulator